jgi:hypothetical protein
MNKQIQKKDKQIIINKDNKNTHRRMELRVTNKWSKIIQGVRRTA